MAIVPLPPGDGPRKPPEVWLIVSILAAGITGAIWGLIHG